MAATQDLELDATSGGNEDMSGAWVAVFGGATEGDIRHQIRIEFTIFGWVLPPITSLASTKDNGWTSS